MGSTNTTPTSPASSASPVATSQNSSGEQSRAGQYLRQLETVCNHASVGLLMIDERKQCVYMNCAAEQLTGYTLTEAQGRPLHDLLHHTPPDGSPCAREECRIAAFPLDNQKRGKEIFVRRNGASYPAAYTFIPIREGDTIAGAVLEVRDITDEQGEKEELAGAKIASSSEAAAHTEVVRQLKLEREQLRIVLTREQDGRQTAELLNQLGPLLLAERDTQRLAQRITDLATQLTAAEFGALFHNVLDESGGSYMLYTLSGVSPDAFKNFPMPRNTALFAPTFSGEAVVRSDDITQDLRYGKNAPHRGMPPGHLPVRSYLAVPIVSRSGEVIGGLFFGHSQTAIFTAQHEERARGIAAQAAIALDNARLFTEAQQSRERYEFLADSIPQMVWTANPDGRLDYVNQQTAGYFGSRREDVTGMGWLQSVHKEDRAQTLQRWEHSLKTGDTYEVGFRLRRASDGEYRWHLVRAFPMHGPDGAVVKWFGTCTDIEDQKRIESQLRRANQDLEQFAYSASHDLREPLRQVATFTQMLQRSYKGRLDERADEFIGYAVQGALRMEMLVRDLLAYTQAANVGEAPVRQVDLEAIVNEASANLKMAIQENGAVIESNELPAIPVHQVQLVQIFQNLIGNAIKYRGASPPRIRISAEREGARWRFCVEDNGIGIAPKYHSQIFGLFKRLHGSATYTGTGIGLAICQKIVEQHGGRIWVDSALGEGARFYFTLPA